MIDDIPCRNTINLNEYLNKQAKLSVDQAEIEKIVDLLVEEEIVCVRSKDMIKGLYLCEDEWDEFIGMEDISIELATLEEVRSLARLAQNFKNKLSEQMRDVLEPKAKQIFEQDFTDL